MPTRSNTLARCRRALRPWLLAPLVACVSVGGTVGGAVGGTIGTTVATAVPSDGLQPAPAGPDAPAIPPPPPLAPLPPRPVPVAAVEHPTDPVSPIEHRLGHVPPKTPGVPRVLFFGDSLTSGFGLADDEPTYPTLIARSLAAEGVTIEAVNGGIAGDTSFGGRQRIGPLVLLHPDIVVIELGGNDFMLDVPLENTAANLRALVKAGRDMGARVVLVGIRLPPGVASTARGQAFEALYPSLAAELSVPLVPDILEDALGQPRFMQADGLHPNAEGQRVLAANVLPVLRAEVAELEPTP
jgi:acyl-CoA thioesterase-1